MKQKMQAAADERYYYMMKNHQQTQELVMKLVTSILSRGARKE